MLPEASFDDSSGDTAFLFQLGIESVHDCCLSLFRWINRPPLGGLLRDPSFQVPSLPVFKNTHLGDVVYAFHRDHHATPFLIAERIAFEYPVGAFCAFHLGPVGLDEPFFLILNPYRPILQGVYGSIPHHVIRTGEKLVVAAAQGGTAAPREDPYECNNSCSHVMSCSLRDSANPLQEGSQTSGLEIRRG